MMKGEGFEKEVQENSKSQSHKHTQAPLGMPDADVSSRPRQQDIVGLNDTNGPNMSLTMDITIERAQPECEFKFASNCPTSVHGNNTKKLRGGGSQKTKIRTLKKGKENIAGEPSNSIREEMTVHEMAMDVDGIEVGTKRRCRTPLTKLQEEDGNRKRVKVEGEVKELRMILKQYLGSVEATEQPRRTQ